MKKTFKLKGLDCANCAAKLENEIQKIDGVENATVSFMTEKLVFEVIEGEEDIIKKVKKIIKREEPDIEIEEI